MESAGNEADGPVLSQAVQDYLKAIYKLAQAPEAGEMVTTSLIAERMGVSAASATNMIKRLAQMRLLDHRPYQGVGLTAAGEKMALGIIRHHRLLELYLREALGYEWDAVDAEAERLEHAISEDLEDRIDAALGFPTVGAHGEPIPTKDGDIAVHDYRRLSDLEEGERGRIRQVSDRDPALLRYLEGHGLVLGAEVRVREKPLRGHLCLTVGAASDQEIGFDAAERIYIDVLEG